MTAVEEAVQRSLYREVHEFITEVLEAEDEVNIDKLVRLAHAHFDDDEWIREQLVREGLNRIVPAVAGHARHELRRRAREANDDKSRRERMASVFEHVGDGFSKSILAMTRRDHVFAAEERETAAAGLLRWAGFHRGVARLHKSDKTTTADLDPKAVNRLWIQHIERSD